ncbi:MAG: hypothetical protein ACYTFE_08205 [Planctomycetota bacterium]|jgi:hypothetical protein
MNATAAIFRYSVFFFVLVPLFAIWGFWVTYFTRPAGTYHLYEHFHGAMLFGWCLMLILQSSLIRANRRDIHRRVGKVSYIVAPLLVISTILLANHKLNVRGLNDDGVYILSLQVFLLIQWIVPYTLAMKNRKRSDVHARWMICTVMSMLDPIFARVIAVNFLEVPFSTEIYQYFTYSFVNLILIALIVWDWKSHRRRDVFLPMLFIALATQLPSFFVVGSSGWMAFATWFHGLPLS